MNNDQYNKKILIINERLKQISERTEQMAHANSANTDNPNFNDMMNEFDALVKKSDEITTEMLKVVGLG